MGECTTTNARLSWLVHAKPKVRMHRPLVLNGALKAHQEVIWGKVFPLGRTPGSLVWGRGICTDPLVKDTSVILAAKGGGRKIMPRRTKVPPLF